MDKKDRRIDDLVVAELARLMRSMAEDFRSQAKLMISVKDDVSDIKSDITLILSAFPKDGIEAHRRDHEEREQVKLERRDFRQSVSKGLVIWGAAGVIPIVLYALWEYFKVQVHR